MIALTSVRPLWRRRRPTRARLTLAASAATLLAIVAYRMFAAAPGDVIHEAVSQGRATPAPEFEIEVLTAGDLGAAPRGWWRVARDGRVSLGELRGSPIVISFWTGDCTPCRQEAPRLERAAGEAGHGVVMLGVSTAQATRQARESIHASGTSFPQLHDGSGDTARRWGVDGVPETFFLSRDGVIVAHVVGAATAADLRTGVEAAIAGRPAGLRTGGRRQAIE